MEILFKTLVSLTAIFLLFWFLSWIWTHQIDLKETILRFLKSKPKEMVELIVTRDENTIYQNGQIVGNVSGNIKEINDKFIFDEIYNTSNLNRNLPIEYRREKLKIISIGSSTTEKRTEKYIFSSGTPEVKSEVKHDVINNVICEKIN